MSQFTIKKGDTLPEFEVTHPELVITTGWTCSASVLDETGTELLGPLSVTETNDAMDAFVVSLTPAQTATLAVETYKLVVEIANASLTPPVNEEHHYILNVDPEFEAGDNTDLIRLTVAENSFVTYETLLIVLGQMPLLKAATKADRRLLKAALVQAYHNIGLMTVDFGFDEDPSSTSDYTSVDLSALETSELDVLVRAQLTEANLLLGANPIEDRRRAGLLSDSVGESAHFFRTTKPLQLPVYRETAHVMKGYIVWDKRVSK